MRLTPMIRVEYSDEDILGVKCDAVDANLLIAMLAIHEV